MTDPLTPDTFRYHLQYIQSPVHLSRILLALALAEYPESRLSEIASMIDVPYETVRSWSAKLSRDGLDGLMSMGTRRRRVSEWLSTFRGEAQEDNLLDPSYFPLPHGLILEILRHVQSVDPQDWYTDVQRVLKETFEPVDLPVLSVRPTAGLLAGDEPGNVRVLHQVAGHDTE